MKTLFVNRNVIVSILTVMLLTYSIQGISYGQEAPDTVVEFKDINLAREVRRELGLPTGGGVDLLKIPKVELRKLTELGATHDEIIDLTGLEHATQLKELELGHNDINDISLLAGLTQLRKLDLAANGIRDISPLAGLTNLTWLRFYGNGIRDISPLAGLTNLTWLHLSHNQLRDISSLTRLTNLTYLSLSHNQVSDISPLAGLTNLISLYLAENLIRDVTPLVNLIYLKNLSLAFNPITDKSPLRVLLDEFPGLDIDIAVVGPGPVVEFSDVNLAKEVREHLKLYIGDDVDILKIPKAELAELKYLDYDLDYDTPIRRRISDLTGLEHATQLIMLSFRYNNISDITPLTQLTQLTTLDLSDNNISDITPLTQLTQLTTLDLSDNNISDITPLTQLTQLTRLDLGDNEINDITPLTQLTQLRNLDLGRHGFGNNIVDITPLSQLTQLTTLSIGGNNISDLTPLTQLTLLTKLNLGGNNISDLTPLTQLTLLRELELSHNNISDLTPLAEMIQLRTLRLFFNLITDVTPLAQLRNLDILSLSHNYINDLTPLAQLPERTLIQASSNPVNFKGRRASEIAELAVPVNTTAETTATTGATVSISPASVVSPAVGEQITFNLNIAGGEAVAGYQATVQFDDTAFRYVSSENGDFLPAGAFFVEPKVEGNFVKLNAASLAGETNGDGMLATLTFEVIAVNASILTLSDALLTNSDSEAFVPTVENAEITEAIQLTGDINGDGIINIQDLVLTASNLGKTGQNPADVNGDGSVNIQDLVLVAGALGISAAAPSLHPQSLEMLTATDIKQWLSAAQQLDLTDTTSQRGILFLQQLLITLTPKETALLPNYPNPFNPETWIPYHLAKDADVTLHIYAVNGTLVRTLTLGHKSAGMYQNRSRAAYWDGKNAFGESVASGIYFYTLTAGDFTATRKMLIRK